MLDGVTEDRQCTYTFKYKYVLLYLRTFILKKNVHLQSLTQTNCSEFMDLVFFESAGRHGPQRMSPYRTVLFIQYKSHVQ